MATPQLAAAAATTHHTATAIVRPIPVRAVAAPASSTTDEHHPHKHRPIPQLLHLQGTKKRLVIGLVGLPARGKTYLAHKLCRYLNWIGYNCATFNIGVYRRRSEGANTPATFFDPANAVGVQKRNDLARHALSDMFTYLGGTGQAAIYDGTNCTLERRKMVADYIAEQEKALDIQVQLVWIEMVCTDPEMVAENIREAKLTSPDSKGMAPADAQTNFIERIAQYEKTYQSVGSDPSEADQAYITNRDCGRHVSLHRIEGYLMSKIAFFVSNLKVNRAPIYITRHGESQHNVKGLIGGDPYLSPNGVKYAQTLAQFIASEKEITRDELEELSVWTSTLKRTLQTAEHLKPLALPTTHWRALIEIQVGPLCDNLTYDDIARLYPDEAAARKRDKLNYRYPQGGESYMDVIARIEPCILELERMSTPVLLVVHRAVARCLYSYFLDLPAEEVPHLDVPLHTVLKLVPKAYGCHVTRFRLPVDSCEDHGGATSPPPTIEEQQAAAEAAKAVAAAGSIPTTAAAEQQKEVQVAVKLDVRSGTVLSPKL